MLHLKAEQNMKWDKKNASVVQNQSPYTLTRTLSDMFWPKTNLEPLSELLVALLELQNQTEADLQDVEAGPERANRFAWLF